MITIKIAKSAKDIEDCLRIREEVFIVEQNVPADIERDEYDGSALHFLALNDDRPIGTARVVLKEKGGVAKIGRVAVRRPDRGKGIGKSLMATIEDASDLKNVIGFIVESQTHALKFYEKLGYEAYGGEFMDAGIPHRKMKKEKSARR